MEQIRKIFITSDLHLGGKPDQIGANGDCTALGRQICRSAGHLTEFIDWVRQEAGGFNGQTELVINGDIVDFFAPDDGFVPKVWIGNEDEVIKRLDRIDEISRQADGRGPFQALKQFLATARCELTLVLGNHDVELSLPRVRRHLESMLDAHDRSFTFIYDGEACVRGRLLIEHGNRYDSYNAVDFSKLRQERSHLSRCLPIAESKRNSRYFVPPAGTLLVVYAWNLLLDECPFLNLLKPETGAVVPLMLALRPDLRELLHTILGLIPVRRRKRAARCVELATPAAPGLLAACATPSAGNPSEIRSLPELLREELGTDASAFLPISPKTTPGSLGSATSATASWEWLWKKATSLQNTIGWFGELVQIVDSATEPERVCQLRIALQRLAKDRSFDVTNELSCYTDHIRELLRQGHFQVVVFGHTHLQKSCEILDDDGKPLGKYVNTGTWADVMRLPEAILSANDSESLEAVIKFVASLQVREIDPWVHRYLGYAEAALDQEGNVEILLRSYCGPGRERSEPLMEISQ
jgi:UDP-2,3-diacylglucosamine pyrophosphatase LpxH